MCVHPGHQRQGLATFMLRHAAEKVAEQGDMTITLGTDTDMAAFQLYRRHGFKILENQDEK